MQSEFSTPQLGCKASNSLHVTDYMVRAAYTSTGVVLVAVQMLKPIPPMLVVLVDWVLPPTAVPTDSSHPVASPQVS